MPTLDLREWRTKPWLAKQKLGPVMKFSKDENLRRIAEAYELCEVQANPNGFDYTVPPEMILAPTFHRDLIDGCDRRVVEVDSNQLRTGMSVGLVLEIMKWQSLRGGTSREQAITIYIEGATRANQSSLEGDLGAYMTSRNRVRNAYTDFAAVLPLWSAYTVLASLYYQTGAVDSVPLHHLFSSELLPVFLGVAQYYANFGTTTSPERGSKPFLDKRKLIVIDIAEPLPNSRDISLILFGSPDRELISCPFLDA